LGYALFFDGNYYRVKNVNGFLLMMRENSDFRAAFVELLKWYYIIMDKVDKLAEAGCLEVSGDPRKAKLMRDMTINFAMFIKKEFPEEWEKTEPIEKPDTRA